jgi:hypothetical protein
MSGTTVPTITPQEFVYRLADLFPRGWAGDDAKQSGNVFALLLSVAQQIQFVQSEIQYALGAERLGTATSPELDLASIDFLGDTLPRPAGASDTKFASEIIAQLFQPAATRQALQDALIDLTGQLPRMMEPWNPSDTGGWGANSYWDVDTVANPARWAGSTRYQGYIETTPPSISAIGANNPILTWGTAYWDVPGYFFGIIQAADVDALNDTLNRLRAYGTTIWVKLLTQTALQAVTGLTPPSAVLNLQGSVLGTTSVSLSWDIPSIGTPPYTFVVLYRVDGTQQFYSGPTITSTSSVVTGLSPGGVYDFEVIIRNSAGASTSAPITVQTALIPPGPAQDLTALLVQATAVTLEWEPPTSGTTPFTYSVNYRQTGTTVWQNLFVGMSALTVTVINLLPDTEYDFEIISSNL